MFPKSEKAHPRLAGAGRKTSGRVSGRDASAGAGTGPAGLQVASLWTRGYTRAGHQLPPREGNTLGNKHAGLQEPSKQNKSAPTGPSRGGAASGLARPF